MTKRIKYKDEPIKLRRVADFLPPPDELIEKEQKVKVTISLNRDTIDFFKAQAKRHGQQYQKMIRRLLDVYASRYAG